MLLLSASLPCTLAAQQPDAAAPHTMAEDAPLEAALHAAIASHNGHVAVFAEDLATGRTVAIDADTPVQTASVIKLAILYTALEEIRDGKAHFEDKLTLKHSDQVAGSGVLTFFDTPVTLTLKDALTMMIIMSDNTATNLAIDHLGLKNIDDQILALGLKNTWLYKKVFLPADGPMPADQKQFGLGKTTAREMASLFERFVTCNLNPPGTNTAATADDHALCNAAMHMLSNQFYRDSIPRYLEAQDATEAPSEIANKTGALDAVRNDVGVVFTKAGPVVISMFTWGNKDTSWTVDNQAEVLMAKLAKQIVGTWSSK
ncbi:serine hydrolase [Silvibacterium dinghuense]|uniref:serine hydrolase n=1 Tax=Silvibacterium dinghuense TaxID=1560006 RepID=UPI001E590D3E|nr:serine hydrolase [Silvibacterium dinghuense]